MPRDAWVSGIKPTGYILHVEPGPFDDLDGARFDTVAAAFTIQRAIRTYMQAYRSKDASRRKV